MVKHLKKLTQHVRELESTISARDAQPSSSYSDGSTIRNRRENTSVSKRGCRGATPEFDQVYYTSPRGSVSGFLDNYPLSTIGNEHAQWIAWKWRWAASSASLQGGASC
ncbi:hypothetical protein M758_10G104800 [Ceratodon purpureus]|nr:hypothetical protein M758_10G104800 [Ceratodon purpureus]